MKLVLVAINVPFKDLVPVFTLLSFTDSVQPDPQVSHCLFYLKCAEGLYIAPPLFFSFPKSGSGTCPSLCDAFGYISHLERPVEGCVLKIVFPFIEFAFQSSSN